MVHASRLALLAAGTALALAPAVARAPAQDAPPLVTAPPAPPASPQPAATAAPVAAAPARAAAAPREQTLVTQDPQPTWTPDTAALTKQAAKRYLAIVEAGGWPAVPAGLKLAAGASGPAVAALKQRLAVSEDLPREALAGDLYDETVEAAVKRFQLRHGLEQTGAVGPLTLQALNVAAAIRYNQLLASAQRAAATSFGFAPRHVVVNIPGAAIEAVDQGRVTRRYVAVVGKADRPSPTVETRITAVNFNPTWTVPTSIIKKDIIPKMQGDPGYLAKARIRILDQAGHEIDAAAIDWNTTQAAAYTLRQDPGRQNSLGGVRIDMPNAHAVYMHDTPSKGLFGSSFRFHSSGCVRVSDVRDFVAWLLENNGPKDTAVWTRPAIDAAISIGNRLDVRLARPVPVAWIYLTGYATPDGTVHFRPDVYDRDSGADVTASIPRVLPPKRPSAADLAPKAVPAAPVASPPAAQAAPPPLPLMRQTDAGAPRATVATR